MALFGRDRGRIETDEQRALAHPTRFRIWGLYTEKPDRALTAVAFHADLVKEEGFRGLSVSQVGYHLACLQDAELIPVSIRG